MKKIFVYIASRQSIVVAKYLRSTGYNVATMTANPDFFCLMEKESFESQKLICGTGLPLTCRGFIQTKKVVKSIVACKESDAVLVLTHNAIDIVGWYLAKNWSKSLGSSSVWFQEMDPKRQELSLFEVIKDIRILSKFLYGRLVFGIPFLKVLKSKIPVLGVNENTRLQAFCSINPLGSADSLRSSVYDTEKKPVKGILFLGVYPEMNFIEDWKLKHVISILEEATNSLFFKPHPRSDEEAPNSLWTRLPDDPNVESSIGSSTVVVGIASGAMVFSSKTLGVVTVSLSRLLLGEGRRHSYWTNFLHSEGACEKVLMPTTFEALRECLSLVGACEKKPDGWSGLKDT
jgi:hypothetical protein